MAIDPGGSPRGKAVMQQIAL